MVTPIQSIVGASTLFGEPSAVSRNNEEHTGVAPSSVKAPVVT